MLLSEILSYFLLMKDYKQKEIYLKLAASA